jgi:hypothetical protein
MAMKIFSSKKRAAAIGAVTAATLLGGTVAFAYWTTTGSGTGSATAGDPTDFTIVEQSTSGDPLTPGGPVQTAVFKVHNGGSGQQYATKVVVSVASEDGTAWSAVSGCSAADFVIGGEEPGASHEILVGEDIAPGLNSTQQSVTIQMWNDPDNAQNACQGVTVPLHYAVS